MIHAEGTGGWWTRCHANAVVSGVISVINVLEENREQYGTVSPEWKEVTCQKCLDKMPKRVKAKLLSDERRG